MFTLKNSLKLYHTASGGNAQKNPDIMRLRQPASTELAHSAGWVGCKQPRYDFAEPIRIIGAGHYRRGNNCSAKVAQYDAPILSTSSLKSYCG
jgi:hypothetical protein